MLPHEVVSKYVIPYIRGLVAIGLSEHGLSQIAISKLLGITQPMVRRYLSQGKEYFISKLRDVGLSNDEINVITRILVSTALRGGYHDLHKVFSQIINFILSKEILCDFHRKIDPNIPRDCNLCPSLFPPKLVSDPYIEDVRNAFKYLQLVSSSYLLAPEVGMNIVRAPPKASRPEDIVGFTGRIIRVGNRLVAVGEPIYGGSRHTAMVLLTIRSKWSTVNSVVVVKYDENFIQKLKKLGFRIIVTGPHNSKEAFIDDLRRSLEMYCEEPDAIVDLGGLGLEPVIYILGRTALDAVKKALLLITS